MIHVYVVIYLKENLAFKGIQWQPSAQNFIVECLLGRFFSGSKPTIQT